ncbi:MAG: hypothetical protein MR332_01235 [Fusicatenibacter sp.]|nr:hypothetical protein [Fusicatenibacter sp.]
MTMKERIKNGLLFTDECEGMPKERLRAKKLMKAFNETSPEDLAEEARLRNQ